MGVLYEDVLAQESTEMQERVRRRSAELIAHELRLRELRRIRKMTQQRLSKKLKIGQEGVSRIEQRTDLYLSTLRSYVEGVGGKLSLIVEFPDRPPILLTGLGDDSGKNDRKAKKKPSKSSPKEAKSKAKGSQKSGAKSKSAARRAA